MAGLEKELDEIWKGDQLGRRSDADFLYAFLVERIRERRTVGKRGSYVVNVDASWGRGKSYFIERMFRQVRALGHPAIFVDAWRNDFTNDPFTAVLSEFNAFVAPYEEDKNVGGKVVAALKAAKANAGKIFFLTLKGAATKGLEKVVGTAAHDIKEALGEPVNDEKVVRGADEIAVDSGVDSLAEAVNKVGTDLFDKFATDQISRFDIVKQSASDFIEGLRKIVALLDEAGSQMPMFVFIDELDRCRPTYAVEMLERVKHLFDIDNVVFLIATDTEQLSHAIRAVYGEGFDSTRYLTRFFNRPYKLHTPMLDKLVGVMLADYNIDMTKFDKHFGWSDPASQIASAYEYFEMDIRQLEQAIDMLASVVTVWRYPDPILLQLMIQMIIGILQKGEVHTYEGFMAFHSKKRWHNKQQWVLPTNEENAFNTHTFAGWALALARNATLRKALEDIKNLLGTGGGNEFHQRYTIHVFQREIENHSAGAAPLLGQYYDIANKALALTTRVSIREEQQENNEDI